VVRAYGVRVRSVPEKQADDVTVDIPSDGIHQGGHTCHTRLDISPLVKKTLNFTDVPLSPHPHVETIRAWHKRSQCAVLVPRDQYTCR
jgi:hypothetical protein